MKNFKKGFVLITSNNCKGCKIMKQHLDGMNIKYEAVNISKIDITKYDIFTGIKSAPVLFYDGKIVFDGAHKSVVYVIAKIASNMKTSVYGLAKILDGEKK